MKYRKSSLFLVTLMILAMLGAAFVSVPTVSAYTITVDGNLSDWLADTSGQGVNTFQEYVVGAWPYTKEYVWKDALGDDTGNGSYLYPYTGGFTGGEADLLEFRVTWDANYLYLAFRFADLSGLANGTAIGVGIDTDRKPDSGLWWAPPSYCDAVYLEGTTCYPEYELVIAGPTKKVMDSTWTDILFPPDLLVANDTTNDVFEVGIPTDIIGDPGQKIWTFSVLIGVTNMNQEWEGYGNTAEVFAGDPATNGHPNNPGGGVDGWIDPDIFDMAFYPDTATQEAELNDFGADWPDMARLGKRGGNQAIGFYNMQQGELYVGNWSDPNVYDPLNKTLPDPCNNFTAYIKTRNITGLWGVSFYMNFDHSILQCTAVRYGTSWGTVFVDYLSIPGTIDNNLGKIIGYDGSRMAAALPDNATIFEIEFHVNGTLPVNGLSILQIYCKPIELRDKDLYPIFVPKTDGKLWGPPPGPPKPPIVEINENATTVEVGQSILLWATYTQPASNGTQNIPIANETWTIRDSMAVIVYGPTTFPGSGSSIVWAPPYADTFTVTLFVMTQDDPILIANNMNWDDDTAGKLAYEKKLTGIDCFTNKGRMWNYTAAKYGWGPNMPADAYTTDELVTLYAYVFYNGWPKPGFLVSFSVYDPTGELFILKQNMTDQSGIAWIQFRIPTPTEPHLPYSKIFGRWYCFQKVRMSDEYYNDTLEWDVGWIVKLTGVTPVKPSFTFPEHMNFTIYYENIAMAPRNVIIEIEVYDDEDVPIAMRLIYLQVPGGDLSVPFRDSITVECLAIPKWFYPGIGKVIVNVFMNALPIDCGSCPSPPISATFLLLAPEVPPPDPGW